jgi:hypothetical protein
VARRDRGEQQVLRVVELRLTEEERIRRAEQLRLPSVRMRKRLP